MNHIAKLKTICKQKGGFYLMRHGQTDWNVKKIYMGSQDIQLNEKGRSQALESVENLRNLEI